MTVDIITEFAFGSCANITNEHPNSFDSDFLKAFDLATEVPYKMYYSAMQRLAAKFVPLSIAGNLDPALRQMAKLVQMAASSHNDYTRRTTNSSLPVIFDHLQSVPDDLQKTESIDILVAGSDTTAFTLTTALYHILSMPEVEKTLVGSLDEVFGASQAVPSLLQLEQIKYLVRAVSVLSMEAKHQAHTFLARLRQRSAPGRDGGTWSSPSHCTQTGAAFCRRRQSRAPRCKPPCSLADPSIILTHIDTGWNVGVHDAQRYPYLGLRCQIIQPGPLARCGREAA
jgi:hypothetical protein